MNLFILNKKNQKTVKEFLNLKDFIVFDQINSMRQFKP